MEHIKFEDDNFRDVLNNIDGLFKQAITSIFKRLPSESFTLSILELILPIWQFYTLSGVPIKN